MSKRILIVNDGADAGHSYTPFFARLDYLEIVNDAAPFLINPKGFSLVVFTGGSDVQPELYGDTSPKGICWTNPTRDKEEAKIFNIARNNNISMFGICRGVQFINVMAGGRLIHDVTGHHTEHDVSTSDGETFRANSLHHQAIIPPKDAEVVAWSTEKRSMRYIGDEDEQFKYFGPEVEAVHYPKINAAGVQWHPEALNNTDRANSWAYLLVRDTVNCRTDAFRKLYYIHRPRINYVQQT